MSQILDKKQIKKLQEYEAKKYKDLHSSILNDDGNPRNDKS